jgi:hypothetical protein
MQLDLQASLGGEPVASTELLPDSLLDQGDVRSLVDFFLLLKKWDTLSTRPPAEVPNSPERVAE